MNEINKLLVKTLKDLGLRRLTATKVVDGIDVDVTIWNDQHSVETLGSNVVGIVDDEDGVEGGVQ